MSCTVGLKRKLKPEDEDDPKKESKVAAVLTEPRLAYSLQRQAVLQLSLQKLCSHVEMALVRRVLVTNTLRYIQRELSQQGALIVSQTQSGAAEVSQGKGAGSLTPAWVLEQDGELLFSLHSSLPDPSALTISRSSPKDSFSTALAEIDDLCPTLFTATSTSPTSSSAASSSVSPLDLQCSFDKNGRLGAEPSVKETETHSASHGPCDSLFSPILPPELSLDDFLFSDIDNFLCELNPCSNPSLGQGAKVVSMVTDDLARSLTNQPFKTDLNELDHIMEVLVSS